jgi:hypothetical protein
VVAHDVTPPSLVRLATADGFDPSFQMPPALAGTLDTAELAGLRRADMAAKRLAESPSPSTVNEHMYE